MAGYPNRRHDVSLYRSGLEDQIADAFKKWKVIFEFEQVTFQYIQPEKKRRYTPDFTLENGIVIESKGRFSPDDRAKHLLIQKQYPDLELRFVFSNARARIAKGAKTRMFEWCEKHGFKWAHKEVPRSWTQEDPFPNSIKLIKEMHK